MLLPNVRTLVAVIGASPLQGGFTPLHGAAGRGDAAAVALLLSAPGIDPAAKSTLAPEVGGGEQRRSLGGAYRGDFSIAAGPCSVRCGEEEGACGRSRPSRGRPARGGRSNGQTSGDGQCSAPV